MDLSNTLIYGDKLRCGSSTIADAKLSFSSLRSGSSWIKEVRAFLPPLLVINFLLYTRFVCAPKYSELIMSII